MAFAFGISESVYYPVTGVTKKKINGVDSVWVINGWMSEFEYKRRTEQI